MKIALGTVQFGLDYGIANQAGRVTLEEVKKIIDQASLANIDTIDTAIAYGNSESILGQANVDNFQIITKLPPIPEDCSNIKKWTEGQITDSLNRLNINNLQGVLLHQPSQLISKNGDQLLSALHDLKAKGLTKKIGISIYDPQELDKLENLMPVDIVQAPLNILDSRLIDSGWLKKLKNQGTEIHIRSVFLQGLLLMNGNQRPQKFSQWSEVWQEWSRWLDEIELSPLQACLGYILNIKDIDKLIVGVDSALHLQEILAAAHAKLPNLPHWPYPIDTNLITPSNWNTL
jgi:aryl-alcohol dehydrogenase-like predicted oxidoreductase